MVGSTLLGNEEGHPSWSEGTVCATRMEVVFVKQENCTVPCGSKGWPWEWLPSQESRISGSRAVIVIVTVVTYNGCVLGTALRALNC